MSKASDALTLWMMQAEDPDGGASWVEASDVAGGFKGLGPDQQVRFVELVDTAFRGLNRGRLVEAMGRSKRNEPLEAAVHAHWSTHEQDRSPALAEAFVALALREERGWEAARWVNAVARFTSYPGLAKKLDALVQEFSSPRLVELAAEALGSVQPEFVDAKLTWTMGALFADSGRDELLEALSGPVYAWVDGSEDYRYHQTHPGSAGRLAEVLAKYATTERGASLAREIADRVAVAEAAKEAEKNA